MTAFAPEPPPATSSSPSGCKIALFGCGALLLLGAAAVVSLVLFVFGAMKSTDAYRVAREKATTDPRVIEALGAPVHESWWVTGNVKVKTGGEDKEAIVFGVSGSRGKGTVTVDATREKGHPWVFHELEVRPDHGPAIDLLHP